MVSFLFNYEPIVIKFINPIEISEHIKCVCITDNSVFDFREQPVWLCAVCFLKEKHKCDHVLFVFREQPVWLCVACFQQTASVTMCCYFTENSKCDYDIPCGKTFLSVWTFLILWPWHPTLTYFWKNWTLALTFETTEIVLSYYTWIFLIARPFCPYQNFDP